MNSLTFLKFLRELVGMFWDSVSQSAAPIDEDWNIIRETYMVHGYESAVRPADFAAGVLQALEGLRGGDLMDEMSV